MLEFYQNIPTKIDPVALAISSFPIYWYSLMYLVALVVVGGLLYYRITKKETDILWEDVLDFLLNSFLGIIIGGRIGYIIFYNLNYFLANPMEIVFPFNQRGEFVGIYGMSYHGGLVGFIGVTYFFCKYRKINFLKLTDFVLPALPLGYFFGRVGNFLNGELYGRVTTHFWGMNFSDGMLRHPSQLYEAFFEGLILFVILWIGRNSLSGRRGLISGLYLAGYGGLRFIIEFFRQPDQQLGLFLHYLTMGQILSLFMIIAGLYLINKSLNNK